MPVNVSQSATAYLERKGRIDTRRRPVSRHSVGANPVHTYPVRAPLPLPHLLTDAGPDSLGAKPWPHGQEGREVLNE